ncbi:cytochrome c552 [Rhodopseudomonas sp. B29]|uniref:cytochrome c552 n=1 Tax=Rhodopseudomonas sp. B29 TaxID=95607 RepID=UPI00034CACEB|nr:cytochrome c552 [Rhodopseudomonas sp. B29]
MTRRRLRTAFSVVAASLLILAHRPAAASTLPDDAGAGRKLAAAWCAECHAVAPGQTSGKGPDFVQIANLPSTTALSLNVFLRSNHTAMPNLIIAPGDAAEIVQYILSLKRN